ncbi:hypothetical protein [Actinoplanes subtropicus]|uniref:hypothetical protein n=1 Tax=Actinoplanes subtropicus TaxID=543632 RepID=UPI0004C2C028|nr:hypothetical protein [Actinoplanes subtropicus]
MRANRFLAGGLAGVTALAVVAGCADTIKQVEPKLALRDAAQQLGTQKQGGFAVKLTGNVDDLIAAAKKDPDFSADDTDSIKSIFNSTVTVAYDQDAKATAVTATIAGVPGTELRVVDQTLYVKAPVDELVKKFGATGGTADLDELKKQDAGLGAFFAGGWVSLDLKSLPKDGGLPVQHATNEKAAAEVKKSAQNLMDGATVTRDPKDADHLIVTTSTTKAYSEFKRLVTAVAGDKKAFADAFPASPKDRPIVLDLWLDKGKLTAAEINVLQFVDGATGRVAVRLELIPGGPIAVPAGATKIDPTALQGLTGGMTGPAGSNAVAMAQALGYQVLSVTAEEGGKPAGHLKEVVGQVSGGPFKARVVRSGVAEVTVSGQKACLTLPATTHGTPKVAQGAC